MASNENIDCTLAAEIDVTQDVTTEESILDTELIVATDEDIDTIPRIEVELAVTQWSLVSDAIFIKNVTGEEPAWFVEMIDNIIRENDDLISEFEDIQTYLDALNAGYTNLVSITSNHTSQIEALKVSDAENTAAIVVLNDVKITEKQASAISDETITAWMRGGESAAWFNSHVQAVATNSSANTNAIIKLSAEVDGIESSVTEMSEALVEKYQNPDWVGPGDPDPSGETEWLYKARAKHSLEANADGSISGFIADAVSGPEGSKSSFKIFADEFLVCDKVDENGAPGHTAFLIRSSPVPGQPPLIAFDGDVYIGDITDGEGTVVEYNLSDISSDNIVDPVEKDALEKAFSDLRARHRAFQILIYGYTPTPDCSEPTPDYIEPRYSSLLLTNPVETAAYILAYKDLQCMMAELGIINAYTDCDPIPAPGDPCNGIDPRTYVGNKPYAPTTIADRAIFNNKFAAYDEAYNILDSLMSDLVKEIADNSYNLLVEMFSDGKLTPEEKVTINNYLLEQDTSLQTATDYTTAIGAIPDCGTYPYPGNGFEPYSRAGVVYVPYRHYYNSYLCTVGDDIEPICPCSSGCPPVPTQPINGYKTQMLLPVYDIGTAVETILDATAIAEALASFEIFLGARSNYLNSLSASVLDTTFIRIEDPANANGFTLIVDDTIMTGAIGTEEYINEPSRVDGNGIDFLAGKINVTTDPGASAPTLFRIDSEIRAGLPPETPVFNGICNDTNLSEFRANFMEASIGSFAELYSGDVVIMANGKYKVKDVVVKTEQTAVTIYDLIDETIVLDSVRFYSPLNTDTSDEVMDNRIRKAGSSMFTTTMAGGFLDRKSDVDMTKIGLTLQYNIDDSGWMSVPNQITGLNNNQTVMLAAPLCASHVDFRMTAKVTSRGMINSYKQIGYTVALKN